MAFLLLILTFLVLINIPESKRECRTEHFVFKYSRSIDTVKIKSLSKALETNYSKISSHLKTIPAENIEVNVYAHRWRYVKATGNWTASGSIEGTSKLHFVEHALGESNSGKVAVHEFTHAVVLKLLLDIEPQTADPKAFNQKFKSFPIWLWEALSVYEAGQFVDPKSLTYLNKGQYPSGGKIYDYRIYFNHFQTRQINSAH